MFSVLCDNTCLLLCCGRNSRVPSLWMSVIWGMPSILNVWRIPYLISVGLLVGSRVHFPLEELTTPDSSVPRSFTAWVWGGSLQALPVRGSDLDFKLRLVSLGIRNHEELTLWEGKGCSSSPIFRGSEHCAWCWDGQRQGTLTILLLCYAFDLLVIYLHAWWFSKLNPTAFSVIIWETKHPFNKCLFFLTTEHLLTPSMNLVYCWLEEYFKTFPFRNLH